jgi:hypothetical protein
VSAARGLQALPLAADVALWSAGAFGVLYLAACRFGATRQ